MGECCPQEKAMELANTPALKQDVIDSKERVAIMNNLKKVTAPLSLLPCA